MKRLIKYLFFVIIWTNLTLSSTAQSFYAEVINDTVILTETQAWRNCGSMYKAMVTVDGYTLNWYQLDTGMTATCYCVFDLSVTYGPMEPGNYTANFFYTDAWQPADTIFEGSVDFTINSRGVALPGGIISTYQSDCYSGQGTQDNVNESSFRVYPLPVSDGQSLHFEANGMIEDAILEIYSIAGQKMLSMEFKGRKDISVEWLKEEIFPNPGIYVANLRAGRFYSTTLIPVL